MYKIAIIRQNAATEEEKEMIEFPLLPGEIKTKTSANTNEYSIINLGDVVVPGFLDLVTYDWSGVLQPTEEIDPREFIGKLVGIMAIKEVVRLVIIRKDMENDDLGTTDTLVIIKKIDYQEKGGEVGTIFYDIQLQEYKPFGVKIISNFDTVVDDVSKNIAKSSEEYIKKLEETEATSSIDGLETKSLGTFKITAYCDCSQCQEGFVGKTSSGAKPTVGRTIAVDPKVIPIGTRVVIDGHVYTAEDVGGAIKGNTIDLFMGSHSETVKWGVKKLEVLKVVE